MENSNTFSVSSPTEDFTVSKQIQKLRESKKLSESVFSKKCGIDPNLLFNYESGAALPPYAVLASICTVFKCRMVFDEAGVYFVTGQKMIVPKSKYPASYGDFGFKLASFRITKKLHNQKVLSKKSGLPSYKITRLESGTLAPSCEDIFALCKTFSCRVALEPNGFLFTYNTPSISSRIKGLEKKLLGDAA